MKTYFAETLRRLRHDADLTQDKLADFLGVTPQTVSKWERAETYPDVETLPVLANYFHVTVDALLGNDLEKTEQEIDAWIEKIHETGLRDKTAALVLAKEGYRKYPYSYKIMERYANALEAYCPNQAAWAEHRHEIRRVSQILLENCTDDTLRSNAVAYMCWTADDPDDYRKWCNSMPEGIEFNRDFYLEDYYKADTEEGIRLRQQNIRSLMWWFIKKCDDLCGRRPDAPKDGPKADTDTWIAEIEMKIAIYRGIFCGGDFLDAAWNMAWAYHELADAYFEKGDYEKVLNCIEQVAVFSYQCESIPPYAKHTSYLVNRMDYDESKMSLQGACGSPEDYLEWLSDSRFDAIRDDPRFQKVVQLIANGPRNVRIRDESDFIK